MIKPTHTHFTAEAAAVFLRGIAAQIAANTAWLAARTVWSNAATRVAVCQGTAGNPADLPALEAKAQAAYAAWNALPQGLNADRLGFELEEKIGCACAAAPEVAAELQAAMEAGA